MSILSSIQLGQLTVDTLADHCFGGSGYGIGRAIAWSLGRIFLKALDHTPSTKQRSEEVHPRYNGSRSKPWKQMELWTWAIFSCTCLDYGNLIVQHLFGVGKGTSSKSPDFRWLNHFELVSFSPFYCFVDRGSCMDQKNQHSWCPYLRTPWILGIAQYSLAVQQCQTSIIYLSPVHLFGQPILRFSSPMN